MPLSCAAARPCAICDADRRATFSQRQTRRGARPLAQRLALEQLDDDVGQRRRLAEVVNGEDVRMRERGDCLRLALEAREAFGVRDKSSGQHLDRDVAIELRVAGAIHLAHAAGAERRQDFVGPEPGAGVRGICV